MRCGHCKTYDVSISHVRDCSNGRTIQSAVQAPAPMPVTEEGIYYHLGVYYKVVFNLEGTRLYAKVWDGSEWSYDRGAIHRLNASMRVTAEDAARFGQLTGQCVFCSRRLTDERSITVGYGPVCAEHNGLPWGEAA